MRDKDYISSIENEGEIASLGITNYTPPPGELENNLLAITMVTIEKKNLEERCRKQEIQIEAMKTEISKREVEIATVRQELNFSENRIYELDNQVDSQKRSFEELQVQLQEKNTQNAAMVIEARVKKIVILLSTISSICAGVGINLLTSTPLERSEVVLGSVFIVIAISLTVGEYFVLNPSKKSHT